MEVKVLYNKIIEAIKTMKIEGEKDYKRLVELTTARDVIKDFI